MPDKIELQSIQRFGPGVDESLELNLEALLLNPKFRSTQNMPCISVDTQSLVSPLPFASNLNENFGFPLHP